MNEAFESITRLGSLAGDVGIDVVESAGGMSLRLDVPRVLPVKLTGESSGAYAWTEQERSGSIWIDRTGGLSGTTSSTPARDINGHTGIPTNTIVWAWPAHPYGDVDHWLFDSSRLDNGLTVEAADGSPSYTGIHTIRFDELDGFRVTNPAPGIARLDLVQPGGVSGSAGGSPNSNAPFLLTVREDDLTPSYDVSILEFRDPTFTVDQYSGAETARVRIRWGTQIQPVGTANFPGTLEQASRVDHIHQLVLPPGPPATIENNYYIWFDFTTNTLNVYNYFTDVTVQFCPCGTGSGFGSGASGSSTVRVSCCTRELPTTLYLTFNTGQTVELNWVAPGGAYSSGSWQGSATLCGSTATTFVVNCTADSKWQLGGPNAGIGDCSILGGDPVTADSCDPLHITFSRVSSTGCCTLTSATVYE